VTRTTLHISEQEYFATLEWIGWLWQDDGQEVTSYFQRLGRETWVCKAERLLQFLHSI
jgi:hypothetical protein